MPPVYTVAYRPEAENEDFSSIPRNLQIRILRAIESRLMVAPAKYGQRLRRALTGLWKLRVGDYRVVFELQERRVTVWAIRHRKEVYDEAEKRWTH